VSFAEARPIFVLDEWLGGGDRGQGALIGAAKVDALEAEPGRLAVIRDQYSFAEAAIANGGEAEVRLKGIDE
jgi:hypothetical protein